jgi:O-acetyl-ADP-ribose deacetylase (regulator of RNase III)
MKLLKTPLRRLNRTFGPWAAQVVVALVFALEHQAGCYNWTHALFGALLFGMASRFGIDNCYALRHSRFEALAAMTILLFDTRHELCAAWRTAFAGVKPVIVHHGSFQSLPCTFDCLVSPANSFALMDGGFDATIIEHFGVGLEERVQREIWSAYRGEQPVGTCLMVPTLAPHGQWLAHCPTMRVPMDVAWTNHAYQAFLAALTTAESVGVQTLACPGLGTGVGHMPVDVCARQMRFAFDCWGSLFTPSNWDMPQEREWRSYGRSRTELLKHRFGLE